MTNKIYDICKWLVQIALPATITLIAGIGLYINVDVTVVIGIIGLVATWVGTLIGISKSSYNKAIIDDIDNNPPTYIRENINADNMYANVPTITTTEVVNDTTLKLPVITESEL